MTDISAKEVAALRQATGAGMMDAKRALTESGGGVDRAKEILREQGLADAAKRTERAQTEGTVGSYLHSQAGRPVLGVMVALGSETDFVAKSDDFQQAANDIAMHAAAARPQWITRDEVPNEILDDERRLIAAQAKNEGKPEDVIDKIVDGRIEKFYSDAVLYDQVFIRSERFEGTVGEMVKQLAARMGENISVVQLSRVAVGEGSEVARVVLKLSGEAFADPELQYGIDPEVVDRVAEEISAVRGEGHEIAIVVGGGNIFRGVSEAAEGMDRANADYMGMLATVINALALRDALERAGSETRVQTAINIQQVAEPYIRLRAIRHLEKGRIVIFAGGTGNPYFTTDTTAALRAAEIGADAVLKATKVDGVYDADPATNPDATLIADLGHMDAIARRLGIMDTTAITMAMENNIPIRVFNMNRPGEIERAVRGEDVGTLVH